MYTTACHLLPLYKDHFIGYKMSKENVETNVRITKDDQQEQVRVLDERIQKLILARTKVLLQFNDQDDYQDENQDENYVSSEEYASDSDSEYHNEMARRQELEELERQELIERAKNQHEKKRKSKQQINQYTVRKRNSRNHV